MKSATVEEITQKGLVYFYFLITPNADAKNINDAWSNHEVLKDYEKPHFEILKTWCREFKVELRKKMKKRLV
jgi:hypothetical protein